MNNWSQWFASGLGVLGLITFCKLLTRTLCYTQVTSKDAARNSFYFVTVWKVFRE